MSVTTPFRALIRCTRLALYAVPIMLLLASDAFAQDDPQSENVRVEQLIVRNHYISISPPATDGTYVPTSEADVVFVKTSGWFCAVFGDEVDLNFSLSRYVAWGISLNNNPATVVPTVTEGQLALPPFLFLRLKLNLHRITGVPTEYRQIPYQRIDLSSNIRRAVFSDCYRAGDLDRLKQAYIDALAAARSLRQ